MHTLEWKTAVDAAVFHSVILFLYSLYTIALCVWEGALCRVLFCGVILSVFFSFEIFLLRKRDVIALLHCVLALAGLSVFCVSSPRCLCVGLWYVIAAFPGHTLAFWYL